MFDLIGVVWTGHQVVELSQWIPIWRGNFSDLASSRSEVSQEKMDREVTKLRDKEGDQTAIDLEITRAGVKGMVHMVTDVSSKAPIVATVLEEVLNRHGGIAEPVHKHGLQQPLGVVEHPKQSHVTSNYVLCNYVTMLLQQSLLLLTWS